MTRQDEQKLECKLFPLGKPTGSVSSDSIVFEQYKMFVDTSESLVARRQMVNRFFFSANALTMSAIGVGISLLEDNGSRFQLISSGIFVLSIVGLLFCVVWRRLVHSFAQLNAGKFLVIHEIERMLPLALFTAEWHALGEGKDPKKYKSSTKTEMTVPIILSVAYLMAAAVVLDALLNLDWISEGLRALSE